LLGQHAQESPAHAGAGSGFLEQTPAALGTLFSEVDMTPELGLRPATPDDAEAVVAIYAPYVRNTAVSFEVEPPSVCEMRERIVCTLQRFPWLVGLDAADEVSGDVYAMGWTPPPVTASMCQSGSEEATT
jgi:hypothetical protein